MGTDQDDINYRRIEKAIVYIRDHFRQQPDLEEVAAAVHMSPFHFQRMFTEWAGVSPKKFMQYLSLQYARDLLANQASILDTAYETGFSGTSRLHDLFIRIEGMTPGDYKSGGKGLNIHYSFVQSPFGELIVASTPKGICHMAFTEDRNTATGQLRQRFPAASLQEQAEPCHQDASHVFRQDWQEAKQIRLHLAGTPFQLKVWETLLAIPPGHLTTYGHIAETIGSPNASRAVGTAVGSNPVAFLIPCHRVIRASGVSGGYMWGPDRKSALIGWEAARIGN